MVDTLVIIVFGWPFIILSILLSLFGLIAKRYWPLILGAVLSIPFSYYLSGAPGGRGIPLALPLFQFGSAFAIYRQKALMAWLLLLPILSISIWLAALVITQ